MAILNATAMERDLVNLGWSVPVQKCQQVFETVAARHRSTLHYCLSRYSPCGLVPMARRGRLALLTPMRSTSDLAFRVRVLASVGSPNLIQDFALSRDGQEREQGSEDNPNVHAHQGKPCDAWEVWTSAQPLYLRAPARQPARIARWTQAGTLRRYRAVAIFQASHLGSETRK